MQYTRRRTIGIGIGTLAALKLGASRLSAQESVMEGDRYPTNGGAIVIHPVDHASFVMETPGAVVYVDPVGGAAAYERLPPPDIILITHEHGDHYDVPTLEAIVEQETDLVTNPAVYDMLPEALKTKATALANGDSMSAGDIAIEAIPAYNTTPDRLQYHPEGRDNGYVLGIDGQRVYIAGDTEDIPEMRALENIDIAFVPMNLPNTMAPEQAANGVAAFAPRIVYPYHYRDSDLDAFEAGLTSSGTATQVVRGDWYS